MWSKAKPNACLSPFSIGNSELNLLSSLRKDGQFFFFSPPSLYWEIFPSSHCTHRLVFIDGVLHAARVLWHPRWVEYRDTGHAQDRGGQREVDAGRWDLCGRGRRQIDRSSAERDSGVRGRRAGGNGLSRHLKDLLGSLLHSRPHLVAEAPQRVELQDRVDALARLLVVQLSHHHLCHSVGHLDSAQQEHCSCRVGDEHRRQTGNMVKC